jgi:hypothetical protein
MKSVELPHAALPAHANHLVAPTERVLHHVLPELSGRLDDADFHRGHPVAPSTGESAGVARGLKGVLHCLVNRPWDRMAGNIPVLARARYSGRCARRSTRPPHHEILA